MDIDTKYYKKLNEYYDLRNYIYGRSSGKHINPTSINIAIYFIMFAVFFIGGFILSLFELPLIFLSCISIMPLIIMLSLLFDRKKSKSLINDYQNVLEQMRNDYSPKFDHTKIFVKDYINDFVSVGYDVITEKKMSKTIYTLKKDSVELMIIVNLSFFRNNCYCYINGVKFEKIKDDVEELNRFIKDYRMERLYGDFYAKLDLFCKYSIIKF